MAAQINPLQSRTITVPQATNGGPGADGASAAVNIADLKEPAVNLEFVGTVSAGTFKVQVSAKGSGWTDVGADMTAAGLRALAASYPLVRVKCTVNVAGGGSVEAAVIGREARD